MKHKKLLVGVLVGYGLAFLIPPAKLSGKFTGRPANC